MKTVLINVTKRDIAEGVPMWMTACPVARATARVTGQYVSVTNSCFMFDAGEVPLPKSVQRFVDQFDLGKSVRPFTFTLKVP